MQHRAKVVLLGPQRFKPTLSSALSSLDIEGALAVITAGWQEREGEVEELDEHVGFESTDLRLYERFDRVMAEDPELFEALRRRQDRLQQLQELYRVRLSHTLEAARELMRRDAPAELLPAERRSAIRALRTLDSGHLRRVAAIHQAFEENWKPGERPAVMRERKEIADVIGGCAGVAVAGGHVAVLLNRMRLFGIGEMIGDRPVVAWSAGAMALGERVVLFHDNPPQGRGNAEVIESGLGLYRGVLPLPHARRRLDLDDPVRVALFARRFSPAFCLALDDEVRLDWEDERLIPVQGVRRLDRRGRVVGVSA